MTETRILVCGGRDFNDYDRMDIEISALLCQLDMDKWPPVFISGCAKGADSLAIDWAHRNGFECLEYPANWEKHGKAAGPIRNRKMLYEGLPDIVMAFPGGAGTADMVRRAEKAGVKVILVPQAERMK